MHTRFESALLLPLLLLLLLLLTTPLTITVLASTSTSPSISPRGGPLQHGEPGDYTCFQSECSDLACAPTGEKLQCVKAMMQGFDMEFNGVVMKCDGDTQGFPYRSCTCTPDPVNCDSTTSTSGGSSSDSGGSDGNSGTITTTGPIVSSPTPPPSSSSSSSSTAISNNQDSGAGVGSLLDPSNISHTPGVSFYY
ncbi:uncharacterized protein BP01DRAFT_368919 [Aspergillus saccharolyticus JOP 1030-1]|uniref:Uncharacterized protein n=1 Tax=Aspergillus saccharolyticus JOP 1030-1 TaxID=1450539 RepID=A0A318Z5H2_9EURO|nr:hypothetical protein BP01DRAFT_368919 [Aspergillus saccharolyticus JOP 1030-1]PYH41597.1 hypothetical protein BP01DRAFT_368919 [Aspergillus saccharolyticus JOP 1030-1]